MRGSRITPAPYEKAQASYEIYKQSGSNIRYASTYIKTRGSNTHIIYQPVYEYTCQYKAGTPYVCTICQYIYVNASICMYWNTGAETYWQFGLLQACMR